MIICLGAVERVPPYPLEVMAERRVGAATASIGKDRLVEDSEREDAKRLPGLTVIEVGVRAGVLFLGLVDRWPPTGGNWGAPASEARVFIHGSANVLGTATQAPVSDDSFGPAVAALVDFVGATIASAVVSEGSGLTISFDDGRIVTIDDPSTSFGASWFFSGDARGPSAREEPASRER